MRDLNDLYYFVQVVDHGGFAPAGRALGMPKSKLSRRIAQLEDDLGVRLLQRSSRSFAVTELGHEYYHRCQSMLVEADAAAEVIERTREGPQGQVRLSCPPALLDYQVAEILARFMVQHPRVQLQVESTQRRVDVIAENMDIALRVRFPPLDDSGLVMKTLGESAQMLVASPDLIDRMGGLPPMNAIDALADWPALGDVAIARAQTWCLLGADGAQRELAYTPRLISEDRFMLREAALKGVGLVQMPVMMVHKQLRSGQLVNVLPDWRPRPGIVHAVFPSRRGLLPSVRSLLDFLGQEFEHMQAQLDVGAATVR